ncbi:MAG: hypothetical protein ONA90_01060 [candidate division KSB1 bacterium]|nr:hypothetical protein [candidate division KSB1 bacterium]
MAKSKTDRAANRLTDADLLDQLAGKKSSILWLGRYTEAEVLHLLDQFDVLPALKEKGFHDISIAIEAIDQFAQALKIFERTKPAELLAEFRLREKIFSHSLLCNAEPFRMLVIEWLMLQNPRAQFTAQRPRLPGQRFPGLGQAKRVLQLLVHVAEQRQLAGILNFPEYFHNAYLYLQHFHFCDPRREGIVHALHRDLSPLTLAEISWAIYYGCVIDRTTTETFEWRAEALVLPLHERLQSYYASTTYQSAVRDALVSSAFTLNREKFAERLLDS